MRIICKFKKQQQKIVKLYYAKYSCIKNSVCINIRTFADYSDRECRAKFNHDDNPANFQYESSNSSANCITVSKLEILET